MGLFNFFNKNKVNGELPLNGSSTEQRHPTEDKADHRRNDPHRPTF